MAKYLTAIATVDIDAKTRSILIEETDAPTSDLSVERAHVCNCPDCPTSAT